MNIPTFDENVKQIFKKSHEVQTNRSTKWINTKRIISRHINESAQFWFPLFLTYFGFYRHIYILILLIALNFINTMKISR